MNNFNEKVSEYYDCYQECIDNNVMIYFTCLRKDYKVKAIQILMEEGKLKYLKKAKCFVGK
jgi:hypothetical protein